VTGIAPILGALIGLGVGVDYALFIVTRHRHGLQSGLDPDRSAVAALNTSGRAILFAGGTVCIALLGLLTLGQGFLDGLAFAAAITVACTVLAAVTLLPALFGVLGLRVLSRKQRRRLPGGSGGMASPRRGVTGGSAPGGSRACGRAGRAPCPGFPPWPPSLPSR
jgi:RND superfamily putative drug exporter